MPTIRTDAVDGRPLVRVVQAPVPTVAAMQDRLHRSAEREEALLAQQVPSAFWLDPTMPRPLPVAAKEAPSCPSACGAPVLVMEQGGPKGSLWSCTQCGIDYTEKGPARWRGSRARRRLWREIRRREALALKKAMEDDTPPWRTLEG